MRREGEHRGDVEHDQRIAVIEGIRIGHQLQMDYPEIADDFRRGESYTTLATKYGVAEKYQVSPGIARIAVKWSLSGYDGRYRGFGGCTKFKGLIAKPELEQICADHEISGGIKAREMGLGVHSLTEEERLKIAKRGGDSTYKQRKGVFARLYERHVKDSVNAGREAARQRGQVPWVELSEGKISEIEFAHLLSQKPEYQYGAGQGVCVGAANMRAIADKLNEVYHQGENVRKPRPVSFALWRYRKKL